MPLKEEIVDVRGAKIQLHKGGKGKPILYLHSFLAESGSLPFLELMAREFTIYAPVQPGFGRSEGLEKIDRIEDLVFFYVDLIESLGLDQCMAVGSSIGGWLAAEIAVHHPRLIEKLVLVDAFGLDLSNARLADIFLPKNSDFRKLLFRDPDSKLALELIADVMSEEATVSLYQSRRATARIGWNPYMCDPKLEPRLYRISMPTLAVWGSDDRVVPLAHGEIFQRAVAGSRLVVIDGAGHLPVLEKPGETANAVIGFLKS